jgi:hypothetical protein
VSDRGRCGAAGSPRRGLGGEAMPKPASS